MEPYRYTAFISYRHIEQDRKWAVWLHKALESYRIPKRLIASDGLPGRVGRMFRDEEELAASPDLSKAIETALAESRFLIVICSLATPGSEWVNAEVRGFREMGRGDRILALLVEGEPDAAFPAALSEIRPGVLEKGQPLAADVRPNGIDGRRALRQRALWRLIATIVGCRFDDLRQREQERRIRRAWLAGMLFAALAVILALATAITYRARVDEQAQRERATERLADLYGENAAALMDNDDLPGALVWLAAAVDAAPPGDFWRALFRETRGHVPSLKSGFAQPGTIESFGIAPSSHRFATGDDDGFLRIGNGKGVTKLRAGGRAVNDVRFSSDEREVVTADSDGFVRVWDAATGRATSAVAVSGIVHRAWISSARGTLLTATFPGGPGYQLREWKRDGSPAGSALELGASAKSFAFWEGRGESLVVVGHSQGQVGVYDTRRGMIAHATPGHRQAVGAVAIDNSGRYMASASDDETARVWDLHSGQAVTPPLRHDDMVTSIAFDPAGGRIVTGSWDHTARVWSYPGGARLSAAMESNDGVLSVAFDATGTRVATGAFGGAARVWDAATGGPLSPVLQHDEDVDTVAFAGGTLVTRSGRMVRVWELDHLNPRPILVTHGAEIVDAELSPDGSKVATASRDHTARVWDARTGAAVTPPMPLVTRVLNVAFSGDGSRLATTDDDGNVRVWDAATGLPLCQPLHHRAWAQFAQFTKAGDRLIVAGGDDQVHVWDYVHGREVVTPMGQGGMITNLAASVDGWVAVTSLPKSVKLWNAVTGQPMSATSGIEIQSVRGLVFSPDGKRLAAIEPWGTVRVWDRKLAPVGKPLETRGAIYAVSFNPDGTRLVTVGRDAAREWDVESGSSIGRAMRGGERLVDAVFTADGRSIVTFGGTGRAKIWAASSTRQVACPQWLTGAVYQAGLGTSGIQIMIVRDIGRPWMQGVLRFATGEDARPAAALRDDAEAVAARRVAAAGFLEVLTPEGIVERIRRIAGR